MFKSISLKISVNSLLIIIKAEIILGHLIGFILYFNFKVNYEYFKIVNYLCILKCS